MSWFEGARARLRLLFARRDAESRMDEEFGFHIEMETARNLSAGMAPEEARRRAMIDFGGVERHRERMREERGSRWLEDLALDLRYTARSLAKSPGFAVVAVVTLALGIGANTAIFSVVHQTLLRPLPYEEPDRIVALWERAESGGKGTVADENLRDWREASRSFEAMAYHWNPEFGGPQTVLGADDAVRVWVGGVSQDFFDVFRVQPAQGRLFAPEEQREGGPAVAVVSEGFWQSHLGEDPGVLGRTLDMIDGRYEIVGVMPPGFHYPGDTEIWVPMQRWGDNPWRTAKNHIAVGRLRDGVSLEAAQAELDRIGAAMVEEHGEGSGAAGALAVRLQDELVGELRRPLLLLLGAAGLLLLIACTNLASTLLARGSARGREVAVRAALGARRARLVRQLLTESLLLALAGAAAGLAVAVGVLRAFEAVRPTTLDPVADVGIDGTVLAFTLALAVATAVLFGLLPALRTSEADVGDALRSGSRGNADAGRGGVWGTLVAAEVALAILLLVGSGLLVRSLLGVLGQDAGFDPEHVLTAEISLPQSKYTGDEEIIAFYRRALTELEALPGVEQAGLIQHLPLAGVSWNGSFDIEGRGQSDVYASYRVASPGYFEAMGIPVLRGRDFAASDRADGRHVAVINQSLAEKEWPGQDPIGQRVGNLANEPMRYRGEGAWLTVVGVVADVRPGSLTGAAEPEIYVNVMQHPARARSAVLTLRTGVPPATVTGAARARLDALDPEVPVEFATMSQRVIDSVADRRFTTLVLGAFALVALLLAAVGIYGVVSYSVARRTREIGIRLALGAPPAAVRLEAQARTLRVVVAGAAVGVAGALVLTRLLQGMLWGVSATDPLTFVAGVAALIGVAWLASYIPARRTTRVDPLLTMRAE